MGNYKGERGIIKEVFDYLDKEGNMLFSELRNHFYNYNNNTLKLYYYKWYRQRNIIKTKKELVYNFLDSNPDKHTVNDVLSNT